MNTDTDDWAAFQAALQLQPEPLEVDLLAAAKKDRGTDIISMLVAIYGSKELFIAEYRWGHLCTSGAAHLPARLTTRLRGGVQHIWVLCGVLAHSQLCIWKLGRGLTKRPHWRQQRCPQVSAQ